MRMKTVIPAILALPLLGCGEEQVDAIYYPNKNDLTLHEFIANVGSIENCRIAVRLAAVRRGDSEFVRGDYECGVGPTGEKFGEITVYRDTVR
jgi:hypothetical protein